jgi:copper transport protein
MRFRLPSRLVIMLCAALLLWGSALPLHAHATLDRADPPPNTRLATPPNAIHLWFTEPIEPAFARLDIIGASGDSFADGRPRVDADGLGMALALRPLADGAYTVTWRVVSTADGHATQGSYPLLIGAAAEAVSLTTSLEAPIPAGYAAIRAFNLAALAIFAGVPLFSLAIWTPLVRRARRNAGHVLFDANAGIRRIWTLAWLGWLLTGLAGVGLLLMQTDLLAGVISVEALTYTVFETRFGTLWLMRSVLWMLYGAVLLLRLREDTALLTLAIGVLLTTSLNSHATRAGEAALPFVAADALHLVATSAWIGGLVVLIALIPLFRRFAAQTGALGALVARFSNIARLAVLTLILTGVVAGTLHVGGIEGLLTTDYGRALLVKLGLFMPVLAIAGVNLLLTGRRLRAGAAVWAGRLRWLTSAELVLLAGMFVAVGVMTSISPAVVTLAARADAVRAEAAPPSSAVFEMQIKDGLMVHLLIEPGVAGENTLTVELYDAESGAPIEDASLIRLRARHQTRNLGESETRPTPVGGGRYSIASGDLAVAGEWRIRANIQRPGAFDTVIDFFADIPEYAPAPAAVSAAFSPPAPSPYGDAAPVRMIAPRRGTPWLITGGGELLRPRTDGTADMPRWESVPFPAPVRAGYFGLGETLWLAADDGVHRLTGAPRALDAGSAQWTRMGDNPNATTMLSSHGFFFALGEGAMLRAGEGAFETDARLIAAPEASQPARAFIMLNDHSHALLNGESLWRTQSVGLDWTRMDAPGAVLAVTDDPDWNLLALTQDGLYVFNALRETWTRRAAVDGTGVRSLAHFLGAVYALDDQGRVTRIARDTRIPAALPDDAHIDDLLLVYPDALWALDARAGMLYRTGDGAVWDAIPVRR